MTLKLVKSGCDFVYRSFFHWCSRFCSLHSLFGGNKLSSQMYLCSPTKGQHNICLLDLLWSYIFPHTVFTFLRTEPKHRPVLLMICPFAKRLFFLFALYLCSHTLYSTDPQSFVLWSCPGGVRSYFNVFHIKLCCSFRLGLNVAHSPPDMHFVTKKSVHKCDRLF